MSNFWVGLGTCESFGELYTAVGRCVCVTRDEPSRRAVNDDLDRSLDANQG